MKTAFLFSGQGSQYIGMGQDLYEKEPLVKEYFDKASSILGYDLAEICFNNEELLNQTKYTQPAIFTLSIAILKVLEQKGLSAEVLAGLSLGEYSALVASGSLTFEEGLELVKKRSQLMAAAVEPGKGKMVAVLNTPVQVIEDVCSKISGVSIANYNTPKQIVIGGESQMVDETVNRLREAGVKKIIPLNVSGPFHTPMYASVAKDLRDIFDDMTWQPMKIPVIGNVEAKALLDEKLLDLLSQQVMKPVRFYESIEEFGRMGVERVVEIGPGKTLTSFVKRIDKTIATYNVENIESLQALVDSWEG